MVILLPSRDSHGVRKLRDSDVTLRTLELSLSGFPGFWQDLVAEPSRVDLVFSAQGLEPVFSGSPFVGNETIDSQWFK